jgi:transcription antitermination protein NusB
MQNRREIREVVLKALYAAELSGESAEEISTKIIKSSFEADDDKTTKDFADKLFYRALNVKEEATVMISENLKNWDLERLAALDRIIIVMGITEFLFFDDIPTKVTINECIELAKKYSTFNSGKFVNGILESALKFLNSQKRVVKTGRGLIQKRLS